MENRSFYWSIFDLFNRYFEWNPKYKPKVEIDLSWELPINPKKTLSVKAFSVPNPRKPKLQSYDVIFWIGFHLWILGFSVKAATYLGR